MPGNQQFAAVPTTLYLESFDTYDRRWLKSRRAYWQGGVPLFVPGAESEIERAKLDIAEALMLGDGAALKITGENTALVILAQMFGAHEAAELIRRGIIQFVGQPNDALSMVDPSKITTADGKAMEPGAPMSVTMSYANSEPDVFRNGKLNPDAAATLALQRFREQVRLSRKESRELARRAAKKTIIVPPERLVMATSRVSAAYVQGALAPLGLSPAIARERNEYQDAACALLVTRVTRAETIIENEFDLYCMPEEWAQMRSFVAEITSGNEVLRAVDRILDLRGVADLRSLFRDDILKLRDIPRLREHRATVQFRRWLWSQPDPRDGEAISTEFVAEISGQKVSKVAPYVRTARIAGFAYLQDHVLDAFQMPPELRYGTDAAIGVLSDLVLDRLRRRPPSAFLDEIVQPAILGARSKTR